MGLASRPVAVVFVLAAMGIARADSTRMPRKDTSLPLKEYLDKGMPSPDKPWKQEDYKKATEVLKSLDPTTYPRSGSLRSGMLFARMTDISSLKSEIPKMPVRQRLPRLNELQMIEGLASPYFKADKEQKSNYDRELVVFISAALPTDEALIAAFNELKSTLPKQQAARLEAQMGVVIGLAVADALNGVQSLTAHPPMDADVHRSLLQVLRDRLPPLMKSFDEVQQQRIISDMQKALDKERDADLRKEMADFIKSLTETAKGNSAAK